MEEGLVTLPLVDFRPRTGLRRGPDPPHQGHPSGEDHRVVALVATATLVHRGGVVAELSVVLLANRADLHQYLLTSKGVESFQ